MIDNQGNFQDAVLMCEVVGANTPVILAISAEVKGLSVEYNLLEQSDQWVTIVCCVCVCSRLSESALELSI